MARQRLIKPGFFTNDDLGECSPLARLLFAGLWCWGDRLGRTLDRPRRLKAEILPYDRTDGETLIAELASHGMIERYEVDGIRVIQIVNFEKHQDPHPRETPSELPGKPEIGPTLGEPKADLDPAKVPPRSSSPSSPSSPSRSQQQGGGLPTREELRFAQYPLAASLRQRLGEEWPGIGWTKRADSDNAAVARCGLDACAAACLAYGRASKVTPESLGFFSALLADLRPPPVLVPPAPSPIWDRVLRSHAALPAEEQWSGISDVRPVELHGALTVLVESEERAAGLIAMGRGAWLARLAGAPVRIEAARA